MKNVVKEGFSRLSVDMPVDLKRAFKSACVSHDIEMTEVVLDLIVCFLEEVIEDGKKN